MDNITWLPQQDNYVEGSLGDLKFYIKLKKVSIFTLNSLGIEPDKGKLEKVIVDSLYVIDPNRPERTGPVKIMAHELKTHNIDEMKKIVTNLYSNTIPSK